MCTLNDFLRSTTEIAHIPEHIRAFSGRSNIGRIDDTVTGVQRFYCPPLAADKLAFTVDLNVVSHDVVISDRGSTGHGIPLQLKLQSEKWHPSYIWRKGCVHQYLGNQDTLSLGIETWVIPSAYDDAFYLKIKLQNNSTREIHMELTPNWRCCEFEKIESRLWGWGAPVSACGEAEKTAPGVYQGKGSVLSLFWSDQETIKDSAEVTLACQEEKTIILKAAFADTQILEQPTDLEKEVDATLRLREDKWADLWDRVPHLHTENKALEKAYLHSVFTLFSCIWNSPHFVIQPYYAEAGINGNCLCTYTWGEYYISKLFAMTEKENCRQNILAQMKLGLDSHYALDPITGQGVGPCYNYNLLCIVTALQSYVTYTGDKEFLSCPVDGVPLYRVLLNLVEKLEGRLDKYGELLDYGTHTNLLEMRGSGYEHFVPSPNGERVYIYRYLAEILKEFGHTEESLVYQEKSEKLKKEFSEKLWDSDAKWLKCLYPDMHEELVYSIQIFDLLNHDILSPEQEEGILTHLNEDEFLAPYGVNSVSKADPVHFELGDVDWSGAGAYLGDPANLIEVLFNMHKPEMAWDAAKRILWWSDKYPYWPQSIWVEKQDYSHWEQPICRSGFAFAQAIVFGMFGLQVENGQVSFHPEIPSELGEVSLSNVKLFGETYQITARAAK